MVFNIGNTEIDLHRNGIAMCGNNWIVDFDRRCMLERPKVWSRRPIMVQALGIYVRIGEF